MDDEAIRALLEAGTEAQWAALPPQYRGCTRRAAYKVITRRDPETSVDALIAEWLRRHGGRRIVGDAPVSKVSRRRGEPPVFYVVPRSALSGAGSAG